MRGAAVDRPAAAVLHAQKLLDAFVELVVADAGHVHAERVERLDGRLVVEQCGDERARPDHVPGADGERVRVLRAELLDPRREIRDAAGGHGLRRPAGLHAVREHGIAAADLDRSGRVRLEMSVQVVDREELHVGELRIRARAVPGGERLRRPEHEHQPEGHEDGNRPSHQALPFSRFP